MSSNKYAVPLVLRIKPSKVLCWFLLLTHLASMLAVFLLPLMFYWKVLLLSAVLLSLALQLRRHLLFSPHAIVQAVWHAEHWDLLLRDASQIEAELRPDFFLHPHCIVLHFSASGSLRRYRLCLFKDALTPDSLRHLQVRLRFYRTLRTEDSG